MSRRPDKPELLACFDLPASASFDDAQEAYRDMCFVWHPDRFTRPSTTGPSREFVGGPAVSFGMEWRQ